MSHVAHRQAEEAASAQRSSLGFWIYLMTDCVLFATLFATYAVLRTGTNGGPDGAELFDLPYVLIETLLLLCSSFVCGLAMFALRAGNKRLLVQLLLVTGGLGLTFIGLELNEFRLLVHEGNDWQRSGFLSAYFTLVATHGLHIIAGLLWLAVLLAQLQRKGLSSNLTKRLTLFSMFWHFLDVIWIFIFSIVYLWSGRL